MCFGQWLVLCIGVFGPGWQFTILLGGGGYKTDGIYPPNLGKWSNLTNILQMGLNVEATHVETTNQFRSLGMLRLSLERNF